MCTMSTPWLSRCLTAMLSSLIERWCRMRSELDWQRGSTRAYSAASRNFYRPLCGGMCAVVEHAAGRACMPIVVYTGTRVSRASVGTRPMDRNKISYLGARIRWRSVG